MEELRSALESYNIGEISRSRSRSRRPPTSFAQAVYEKVQAAGRVRFRFGAGESTGDDEVIEDAEYEVVDEEAKHRNGARTRAQTNTPSSKSGSPGRTRARRVTERSQAPRSRLRELASGSRATRTTCRAWARALVRELLPVLDDLERALEAAAQHEEAEIEEGVRLVDRELVEALDREGLARSRPTASSTRTSRGAPLQPSERRRRRHAGRSSRRATGWATASCGRPES